MLTNNIKILPDPQGNPLQRYAAAIYAIDSNVDCPHSLKEAQGLLAELQLKQGVPQRLAGNELRLSQIYDVWNALLPQLAKARRLGIRSRDNADVPKLPQHGIVTPDDLQAMTEFSAQLDIDIEAFESQTEDQRRITRLEADLAAAYSKLARAHNDHERRVTALEAAIFGKSAA